MCGIAGIYLKNKRVKVTQENIGLFCDRLLLEIEHRGKHATGYMAVGWNGSVKLDKAAKCATEFIEEREPFPPNVQAVLLHTRYKTKGDEATMGNNHPVSYNNCFAIHNGSISNDDALFEDEAIERHFQVDSEIIPALLDKHTLDSPETIREALEKLAGSFAFAAMDPIRHPSRLILVKGPSSPLYVFENDNVVVWASEHSIIKDTWGDLVGTPPKPDKIRFVGEGKFLMADDYKALEVHEFKVKPRPIIQRPPVERQNGYAWIRGGRTPAPAASFRRPWDTNGLFNSINDYKKAVADFRANPPEGFKLARRWDLRESYDDKVDFADVKGNLKWPSCMCGHGILGEDMTTHLKYGTICKDCYRVCHQEWQKDSGSKREEDPIEGITLPSVDAGDWENLENWAEIESKLHRYTLTELSDQTGLSQRSIDFLMYRTGTKSQDFGIGMTGLKFALLKAYEKLNEEIVTNYWNEITAEVEAEQSTTSEEAQELADQQMYPWTAFTEEVAGQKKRLMYICEEHNEQFPYGDHCASCVWAPTESCGVEILKREPDNVHPLNPTLQRCKDCGGFYLAGVGCIPCAAEEVKGEVEATIKVTETACCCKGTRNRACKRPISLVVENALVGKQKGYCGSHWDKCGASKCSAPANFTGLDGYRFCHTHCRGRQGIADVAAYRDGSVVIVEVK